MLEHHRQIRSESDFMTQLRTPYVLSESLSLLGNWCRPELLKGTIDFVTHTHSLPARRAQDFYMGAGYRSSGSSMDHSSSPADVMDEQSDFLQPERVREPRAWHAMVFVVDTTLASIQSDFHNSVVTSIKHCVKSWPQTTIDIAVITYGHEDIHVWPVREGVTLETTDVVQGVSDRLELVFSDPSDGHRLICYLI